MIIVRLWQHDQLGTVGSEKSRGTILMMRSASSLSERIRLSLLKRSCICEQEPNQERSPTADGSAERFRNVLPIPNEATSRRAKTGARQAQSKQEVHRTLGKKAPPLEQM